MPRKNPVAPAISRRIYPEEFRRESVQMLLDGHSAPSVAERLGLSSPNILYVWKKKSLDQAGPALPTTSAPQQIQIRIFRTSGKFTSATDLSDGCVTAASLR